MKVSTIAVLTFIAAAATAAANPTKVVIKDVPAFWQPVAEFNTKVNKAQIGGSPQEAAFGFAAQKLQDGFDNAVHSFSYTDENSGLYHLWLKQTQNGIPIENAGVKVALSSLTNEVKLWTSTWADISSLTVSSQDGTPSLSASQAVAAFGKTLGTDESRLKESVVSEGGNGEPKVVKVTGASFALADITAQLKFYRTPQNTLELVWSLDAEMPKNWLNAQVSALDGSIKAVSDWASHAQVPRHSAVLGNGAGLTTLEVELPSQTRRELCSSELMQMGKEVERRSRKKLRRLQKTSGFSYRVIPIGQNDLLQGDRQLVTDPQDLKFSTLGWHDTGNGPVDQTIGNNVLVFDNPQNKANPLDNLPAQGKNFVFDFTVDDKNQEPPQYRDASKTNAFFLSNAMHDIFAAYGFNAQAANFQDVGGNGNDPVIATVQDGSGTDNANFATPPDGRPGRMRMFIFTATSPQRDGALENDIVIHELTHGLSNRLTGGGKAANCLSSLESGGMGEGWSDFFALAMRMTTANTRADNFVVGEYVTNSKKGVRTRPYSTSLQTNPLKFSSLQNPKNREVHIIGEIWESMLNEVYWNLVDKLGFTPNFKDDAKSGKGNTVAMQLVIDGMKLQPCNPTFVQARDSILAADQNNNNGANQCDIWKGFAKRGLGFSADETTFEDAFDLAPGC